MTLEMQPKPIEVDAIAAKHEKDHLLFICFSCMKMLGKQFQVILQ